MRIFFLTLFLFITACQSQIKKNENAVQDQTQNQNQEETRASGETSSQETGPLGKSPSPFEQVRLGLILGPGGSKTFAHIGFLKEIQARKIPVHAIVGLEWGALVASSFAAKGSAHEAEWQLSKLKESSPNWLSNNQGNVKDLLDPIKDFLSLYKAETLKVPFACPSMNLKKFQVYMMAKGQLDQLLPYCLPYPPYFAAYDRSIAGPREIQQSVDYLRRQGANFIVLVNVLEGIGQGEPINWLELSYDMRRKWPGVNERLDIVIGDKKIIDYKSRQDLIQLGSEQSEKFADKLLNRF